MQPLVLGAGTPVLTLHGAIGLVNHASLRPWLDPLAESARVVYYDQWADRLDDPALANADTLTAEADGIRGALGLERVVVFGHSIAASLALEYARRYPDRVLGLVLCCGTPRLDYVEKALATIRDRCPAEQFAAFQHLLTVPQLDDAELARTYLGMFPIYFHRYDPAYGEWLARSRPFRGPAFVHYRNNLLPVLDSLPWLSTVTAPTLVISGRHDLVTPVEEGGARFAAGLPRAQHAVFEESGHFPFVEEPARFVREVGDFLKRVSGPPSALR